ncbi:hypothetical protein Leryth_009319 [Lithospermum erythrorhizon]|nr:hypothetical protein Leryth_009319 [Lithospermum erythrorhizon]
MEGVYKCMLFLVVIIAVIMGQTLATKYTVGGSQGWDESTDFSTWSSGQTFKVGDELEFKYSSGLHSVTELADEKAYKGCDIGSSLKSFNSGSDTIKLDKAGTRYFACGTSGHCDAGMKVKITTTSGGGSSSGATPSGSGDGGGSSSGSTSTPNSTSTTSSAEGARSLGFFYGIASMLAIEMVLFVILA